MSEFSKRMALADDSLLAEHGDPVVYLPPNGGKQVKVKFAFVSEETMEEIETNEGFSNRYKRMVNLKTDASHPKFSGIDNPLAVGQYLICGITYDVHSVNRNELEHFAEFEVRRYGRPRGIARRGHEGGSR